MTDGGPLLRRGLIEYFVASDDLRADVKRFEEGRFEVEGSTEGGRRRPAAK